jgi:glycerol dehydrogenase
MIRALMAPGRYIQGVGVLEEAGRYVAGLGKRALVVWGPHARAVISERLRSSFASHDVELVSFEFSGESTKEQVRLGSEQGRSQKAAFVLGAGGGKAIDTAKAIAGKLGVPSVSFPTIASNDAPTSSCSVYYTDDGIFDGWDVWPFGPSIVLADTRVIAEAPVRWLVSGIGDALATWFEAEAAYKGRRVAFSGGVPTMAALSLGRLCHDVLRENAHMAKMSNEQRAVTPALERVVEANILLSGLGWESGGLATAHTLGNGLAVRSETHKCSHGEKVAFGLAVQLCLDEDIPMGVRIDMIDFMASLGLPVTLREIGLGDLGRDELMSLAESLSEPGRFVHNHVFTVSAFDLFSAIVSADALGKTRTRG